MRATKPNKLFLLGPGAKRLLRSGLTASHVQGHRNLIQALGDSAPCDLWLATSAEAPDELLQEALRMPPRHRRFDALLTLHRPRTESIQPLDDLFAPFVWSTENFRFLPLAELAEVLADERRGDLFIGRQTVVCQFALAVLLKLWGRLFLCASKGVLDSDCQRRSLRRHSPWPVCCLASSAAWSGAASTVNSDPAMLRVTSDPSAL